MLNTTSPFYCSPVDALRHFDILGNEYWSGRELACALGYTRWDNFFRVLKRVEACCGQPGYFITDHICETLSTFTTRQGTQRKRKDVHLSRLASMLAVMNADTRKMQVALGQAYFAQQTLRALSLNYETLLPGTQIKHHRIVPTDRVLFP